MNFSLISFRISGPACTASVTLGNAIFIPQSLRPLSCCHVLKKILTHRVLPFVFSQFWLLDSPSHALWYLLHINSYLYEQFCPTWGRVYKWGISHSWCSTSPPRPLIKCDQKVWCSTENHGKNPWAVWNALGYLLHIDSFLYDRFWPGWGRVYNSGISHSWCSASPPKSLIKCDQKLWCISENHGKNPRAVWNGSLKE